ncbi:MAG: 4-(cytidine 5'-diphospho)-2-C-methyl-D-erythritol kinase [Corynebacterium camporealensis]|uniref:4-(cytidine 5'-diphospho)-2-C-methyl-D-erythritol kinase n=1 Tax=Corynebacterium camporealensis TaxID=161896 RepID=UPI002A90C723|nr:4-(cytidine 5'-diphospho)-2-C-methyl-D-erythritol kinase [Corynebacterium camporealensis]MDY5839379.1 4-(cytidine 5'-diphospho)-2-C-methyl-D-erythritol kinase [Corynebacterium camporealensis]
MNSTQQLEAAAHAKVNVFLSIGPARDDGYHELTSVFQSLDISDRVRIREVDPAQDEADATTTSRVTDLSVAGPTADGVPADSSNLVWKAIDAVVDRLSALHGVQENLPAVELEIFKEIPTAGGMAGGSADAAAALRLADAFYAPHFGSSGLGEQELHSLAIGLGSDVPFTLLGGTALGTGRGENLTPMLSRGQFHWAIILSPEGLSTPAVFKKLDELRAAGKAQGTEADTSAVSQALISGDARQLAKALHNDMQPAALSLRPQLRTVLDAGVAAGALAGMVSGSGPTCAFLCPDADTAQEVVDDVHFDLPKYRGVTCTGPAPGARLI